MSKKVYKSAKGSALFFNKGKKDVEREYHKEESGMRNRKNFKRLLLAGAALVVPIMMFTGPVFAAEVSLPDKIDFGEVDVGMQKSAELVITHTAPSQVVAQISLSSDSCPALTLGATSLTIPAGQPGSVFVYFTPTQGGLCEGTMSLHFTWIVPPFNQDLGTKTVIVTGTGVAVEPEPGPVDMGSILEFFDTSVSVKNPDHKGRDRAANQRLKDLRRMLVKADALIQNGEVEKACRTLNVVRKKIEMKHRPGSLWDDVKGEVLSQLDDMVAQVMADLACPEGGGLRAKKPKHK